MINGLKRFQTEATNQAGKAIDCNEKNPAVDLLTFELQQWSKNKNSIKCIWNELEWFEDAPYNNLHIRNQSQHIKRK